MEGMGRLGAPDAEEDIRIDQEAQRRERVLSLYLFEPVAWRCEGKRSALVQ